METCLFLVCPVELGSAFRFFGAGCSGAGVARGLSDALVLEFLPFCKTAAIDRSVGVPPLGGGFSTLRLFGAGVLLAGVWPVIPRPTLAGDSAFAAAAAVFRFVLLWVFLLLVSALLLLSWSSCSDSCA